MNNVRVKYSYCYVKGMQLLSVSCTILKFLIDDCMSFWPFLAIKKRLLGVPENLVASVRDCQIALIILHKVLYSGFSMT